MTNLITVANCRFLHRLSLWKELALMHGHTRAGEYEKSLQELLHQPLVYLHQLSLHFNGLYYLRYKIEFSQKKKNLFLWINLFIILVSEFLKKKNSLQILQMLNDPNPGVREAAIVCIEVSNIEPIATMGILLFMLITSQHSLFVILHVYFNFKFSIQDN